MISPVFIALSNHTKLQQATIDASFFRFNLGQIASLALNLHCSLSRHQERL